MPHPPTEHRLRVASMALLPAALLLWLVLAVPAHGLEELSLVATVSTGGSPRAVVVDHWQDRNDIVFYDASSQCLGFVDGESLTLLPESIDLPTWDSRPWLAYDRHQHKVFAVTTTRRGDWVEAEAHVIAGRALQATLSLNDQQNETMPDPPDWAYGISGVLLEEALSGSRLLVDCGRCGAIDALDLAATGLAAVRQSRFRYRAPLDGVISVLAGNSLARADGWLYLGDRPGSTGDPYRRAVIDVFSQALPPSAFAPVASTDLDLYEVWPFASGYQSLAGGGSRLYVASGAASFDSGYVAEIDAASGSVRQVIELLYQDQAAILVDWYDPRRVFVLTAADVWSDPSLPLYVHLVYDGQVEARLRLLEGYDSSLGAALAFDPYDKRLYVATGDTVYVVEVSTSVPAATYAAGDVSPLGGTVASPDGQVSLRFAPGATAVTLIVALCDARPMRTGSLMLARGFEVTVSDPSGATMVTTAEPYTMEVTLSSTFTGGMGASALSLHHWDGQSWVLLASPPSIRQAPTTASGVRSVGTLSAFTQETGLFAVLGEYTWSYVPILLGARP